MTDRTGPAPQLAQEHEQDRVQNDGAPAAPRALRAGGAQEEHAMRDRDVKPPNASEPAYSKGERLRRGPLAGLESWTRVMLSSEAHSEHDAELSDSAAQESNVQPGAGGREERSAGVHRDVKAGKSTLPRPDGPPPVTFRQATERWLATLASQASSAAARVRVDGLRARLDHVVVPDLGDLALAAIDEARVLEWRDRLGGVLAPGGVRRTVATLRRAWSAFASWGWVSHDPLATEPALIPPPATTAGCPSGGTCTHSGCRYFNGTSEAHDGRPHPSTIGLPPTVLRRHASCALKLAERGGMSTKAIATELGLTGRRVFQIEQTASLKVRAATAVVEALEAARPRLPSGCQLVVEPMRSMDSGAIWYRVMVAVPDPSSTLVRIRKPK